MQTTTYQKNYNLTATALLIALGIMIPMTMPIKVILGPASYTLASHVPIFIAMFISPVTALLVAIGTAMGFFLAGFPLVITLRAFSHLIFAFMGAYYLQNQPQNLNKIGFHLGFSFLINLIHGIAEVIVVYLFTAAGSQTQSDNFLITLFIFVGLGTIIHGMVDFELSYHISKILTQRTRIKLPALI